MRRRRRAPRVPPGTSCLDPPQLCPPPDRSTCLVTGPFGRIYCAPSVHLVSGLPRACGPGAVLMVPAVALGGNAGPTRSLFDPLSTAKRGFPTQSAVQGFLDLKHSSSSSHVWKLGIERLSPAQRPNGPVGRLWVVSASPVSTRGH